MTVDESEHEKPFRQTRGPRKPVQHKFDNNALIDDVGDELEDEEGFDDIARQEEILEENATATNRLLKSKSEEMSTGAKPYSSPSSNTSTSEDIQEPLIQLAQGDSESARPSAKETFSDTPSSEPMFSPRARTTSTAKCRFSLSPQFLSRLIQYLNNRLDNSLAGDSNHAYALRNLSNTGCGTQSALVF